MGSGDARPHRRTARVDPLVPTELMAKHGSRLQPLDDGSILATGPTPARDTYELVFAPGKRKIHALRLEVLPDPSLPHGRPAAPTTAASSSGARSALASVADSERPAARRRSRWRRPTSNQKSDEDEHYLTAIEPGADRRRRSDRRASRTATRGTASFRFGGGWSVAGDERKEPREAVLVPLEPLVATRRRSCAHADMGSPNKFKSLIGRFRVSAPKTRACARSCSRCSRRRGARSARSRRSVDSRAEYRVRVEKDLATAQWKKKYDAAGRRGAEGGARSRRQGGAPGEGGKKDAKAARRPTAKPEPKGEPPWRSPKRSGDKPKPAAGKPAERRGARRTAAAKARPPKTRLLAPAKKLPPKKKRSRGRSTANGATASARLDVEGAASAWYVSRKVKCDRRPAHDDALARRRRRREGLAERNAGRRVRARARAPRGPGRRRSPARRSRLPTTTKAFFRMRREAPSTAAAASRPARRRQPPRDQARRQGCRPAARAAGAWAAAPPAIVRRWPCRPEFDAVPPEGSAMMFAPIGAPRWRRGLSFTFEADAPKATTCSTTRRCSRCASAPRKRLAAPRDPAAVARVPTRSNAASPGPRAGRRRRVRRRPRSAARRSSAAGTARRSTSRAACCSKSSRA
jgi:hypothetical protein